MSTASCKRQRSLGHSYSSSDTLHHKSKKQKRAHPPQPPAAFWDSLSEQHLTKNALQELNRRNNDSAPKSDSLSATQIRRPITRRAATELRHNQRSIRPVNEYLCHCEPSRLMQIQRSARHGGPDLSDLKGCCNPATTLHCGMSQAYLGRRKRRSASSSKYVPKNSTTPNTTTTKSTGPYDRAFQQHLIDFGIYPHRYEYPDGQVPPQPDNIDEIRAALAQPRPSLSPSRFSDEDFRQFERADAHASKESQVTTTVIPIIEGDIGDSKCVSGQIPFTNLDHLTDGSLVPGNPDRYYGARPEQLDRQIRTELGNVIIPSTQHDLPITPNFFLAAKGPDGSAAVAGRQAYYDGALGARGIHSLHSYEESEPVYNNKAYTITSIYHSGQLKMYACHPIAPTVPKTRPEYITTQIKAYALTSDTDSFRMGAQAYRNGRDWAKKQRDEAIEQANKVARICLDTSPVDKPALSLPNEVSIDNIKSSTENFVAKDYDSTTAPVTDDSDSSDELGLNAPPKKRAAPITRLRKRQSSCGLSKIRINISRDGDRK